MRKSAWIIISFMLLASFSQVYAYEGQHLFNIDIYMTVYPSGTAFVKINAQLKDPFYLDYFENLSQTNPQRAEKEFHDFVYSLIYGNFRREVEERSKEALVVVPEEGPVTLGKNWTAVEVDDGKVITSDGEEYSHDVLISNIGIKETVELFGRDKFDREYLKKVDALKPAEGIKINVALRGKPRIGNTVVFTLDTQKINGYNEPSALTPELAREGYTLIMTHQALRSRNIKKEQKLGLEDLYYLFPELDKDGEVLMVQTYLDGNPVNRVASGMHLDFPMENVYIVGDANKGEGGIEVEGIALGVMKTLESLGVGRFSEWYL